MSRPDSFPVILRIDYFKNPNNISNTPVFGDFIADLSKFGTQPFLTDKFVSLSSNVAAESIPTDMVGPTWSDTSNGYYACDKKIAFYSSKGSENSEGTACPCGCTESHSNR